MEWILLRYGLSEKIGGRNLIMSPTFEWIDESYGAFFDQLANHLPDLFANPSNFLVWPNSPVGQILQGTFPARQGFGLLIAGLVSIAIWQLSKRLSADSTRPSTAQIGAIIFLLLLILVVDVWLMTLA